MKIVENEKARRDVLDKLSRRGAPHPRDEWHVSKLVCCPRSSYFWKIGAEWEPPYPDALTLTFARGRAHHSVLEVYKVKKKVVKRSDIIGHIDTIGDRVTEIFTTMLSLGQVDSIEKVAEIFSIKVSQLKCYLYMSEGIVTEGDLMVFFLMGDYSRPIRPELKVYTLSFEEEELEDHWKFILKKRDVINYLETIGVAPDLMGESYECINCGYISFCKDWLKAKGALEVIEEMLKKDATGILP